MSIIIKGVEMPKENERVEITVYPNGDCIVAIYKPKKVNPLLMNEYHDYDCKAVPVFTPHGRLVDIDALNDVMYHEAFETDTPLQKWDSGCWIRYKMFEHVRDNAPTVIESEE